MPGLIRPAATKRSSDQRWIGSRHALDSAQTATLKVSDFTKSTHYPQGYFPSGLQVNAADPANLKPYTGAAGEVLRFLKDDHQVLANAAGDVPADLQVAVLWHGLVYTQHLPAEFVPPADGEAGSFTFEDGA